MDKELLDLAILEEANVASQIKPSKKVRKYERIVHTPTSKNNTVNGQVSNLAPLKVRAKLEVFKPKSIDENGKPVFGQTVTFERNGKIMFGKLIAIMSKQMVLPIAKVQELKKNSKAGKYELTDRYYYPMLTKIDPATVDQ